MITAVCNYPNESEVCGIVNACLYVYILLKDFALYVPVLLSMQLDLYIHLQILGVLLYQTTGLKSETFTGFWRFMSTLQGPSHPIPQTVRDHLLPHQSVSDSHKSQPTRVASPELQRAERCLVFMQFKEWMCLSQRGRQPSEAANDEWNLKGTLTKVLTLQGGANSFHMASTDGLGALPSPSWYLTAVWVSILGHQVSKGHSQAWVESRRSATAALIPYFTSYTDQANLFL